MKAFLLSPISYTKNISNSVTTIKQAIQTQYPIQLSEWTRIDNDAIKVVLIKFIEGMINFFGFPTTSMSNEQIIVTVNSILEKYYYFRLEDVCMCFKKARTDTKYKGFYSRLDGSVIMQWFAIYDKERDEIIQSLPQENNTPIYTGSECSREEYKDILLTKIAGGDLYANELLQRIEMSDRLLNPNNGEYRNYKYWQKHRYDKLK